MSWKEVVAKKDYWETNLVEDFLEGVVVDKEKDDRGLRLTIESKVHGLVRTPPHRALIELLKEVNIQDRIKIVYKGEKDTGKPNKLQLYQLFKWTVTESDRP